MAELQVIPARHGTATFVPAGQTIKIINTSGTQVVDTWAFALPKPDGKKGASAQELKSGQNGQEEKKDDAPPSKSTASNNKKGGMDLPTQEEAEKATEQGIKEGEEASKDTKDTTDAKSSAPQKSTWSSYVPHIGFSSQKKDPKQEAQQKKDSKTWSSYFPIGRGFSNYVPKTATDTVSSFSSVHKPDPNKSYVQQLQEFSKTPVGAAGMAALTGSGYGGSMYAGYQAWNAQQALAPAMEYMSMPHSRAATLHLRPRVDDVLVSNIREPMLTIVEDTSGGIHDTLMAACDPPRYKGLGVEKWEEHGSCAENLVLALKELNERAGLKGAKGVGADVTINSVPAPLNLFMNIPWDDDGDIGFHAPKSKKEGFVRMKAERDIVVVMSACPQDVLDINGKQPADAHFLVEGDEEPKQAIKRTQVRKRPPPRKLSSSHATSTVVSEPGDAPVKKPVPQRRAAPAKKPAPATIAESTQPAQVSSSTAQPEQAAQSSSATAQPAGKKSVPKQPVKPTATASKPTNNGTSAANGDNAAPVEKKKPRKLATRAKPEAQPEAQGN